MSLVAGLIGFGLIKGTTDISELAPVAAAIVGILLLMALLVGAVGSWMLLRTAHGRISVVMIEKPPPTPVLEHQEAVTAARLLQRGTACTLGCATCSAAGMRRTPYMAREHRGDLGCLATHPDASPRRHHLRTMLGLPTETRSRTRRAMSATARLLGGTTQKFGMGPVPGKSPSIEEPYGSRWSREEFALAVVALAECRNACRFQRPTFHSPATADYRLGPRSSRLGRVASAARTGFRRTVADRHWRRRTRRYGHVTTPAPRPATASLCARLSHWHMTRPSTTPATSARMTKQHSRANSARRVCVTGSIGGWCP